MTRRPFSAAAASRHVQRRRIFIGCEGESERSYAALLQKLLDARARRFHLDAVVLNPGAGDPHELVRRAIARASHLAERHGAHAFRAVLRDADRHDAASLLGRRTTELAHESDMALIWQEPCHEALLLRHLRGCRDLRPSTSPEALKVLLRHWPAYRKAMPAVSREAMLDEAAVLRAAEVEPALRSLLRFVGFGTG